MKSGKINMPLRLLSDTENVGILSTSKQTIDHPKEKHLVGASRYDGLLLHGLEELYEEHAYEEINGALAREIKVAVGPSNLDENG